MVERPLDLFPRLTEWVLDPRNVEAVNTYAPLLLPVFKTAQPVSDTLTSTESSWDFFRTHQFSG
ncbi:hypothetical protein ACFSSC_07275 [Corynebacterium mendelii]|uniref:Uncharacterized protein n=1 Tax=Corynebacterium mendelii TaxID=2765362 RepID=A0A939E328_9CORY|nr:hypothetical protein [Corynebacterium mendelii]MBN9644868.1 hypothetical protein [Corynebacterium mendelii]